MKRINLISGPRNVSTALMYSFAQRTDTIVLDEPLYACYLDRTDTNHPGKEEVLKSQSTDTATVIKEILLADYDSDLLFIKNMAHHLHEIPLDFLTHMSNVFLIREPREMLTSFIKTIPNPTLFDTAYKHQFELFKHVEKLSEQPLVIDSKQLLLNPPKVLQELCSRLHIPFQETMLSWSAGPIAEDGVWAKYWYQNVHKSTAFKPYEPKEEELPERLSGLLLQCQKYYHKLSPYAIKANIE